jgi:ABC-type sulfate transport system permease component
MRDKQILKEQNLFMILFKLIGIIFLLFVICFIAIVIEESFFGGRRRRKLEREARAKLVEPEVVEALRNSSFCGGQEGPDSSRSDNPTPKQECAPDAG